MIAPSQSSIDSTPARDASNAFSTEDKLRAIQEACKIKDLDALVSLATSRLGLVSDEARQEACE